MRYLLLFFYFPFSILASHAQESRPLNEALIETTSQILSLEQEISDEELRLQSIIRTQENLQSSLSSKRDLLISILSALQKLSYSSPPLLFVSPEDALSSVHSSILLGSVLPDIRSETDILSSELDSLSSLSSEITAKRDLLSARLASLSSEESRLSLLLSERPSVSDGDDSLRTDALASESGSLDSLIENIEGRLSFSGSSRSRDERSRLVAAREILSSGISIDILRPRSELRDEVTSQSALISEVRVPSASFESAKGFLLPPVSGRVHYRYGSKNSLGGINRDMAFSARSNSLVRVPWSGWIVYSGPFRSFGEIVILDVGDGHYLVFSGMSSVLVMLDQYVMAGEPIGRMGSGGVSDSLLYVEFRKDNIPIDSLSWWSAGTMEGL